MKRIAEHKPALLNSWVAYGLAIFASTCIVFLLSSSIIESRRLALFDARKTVAERLNTFRAALEQNIAINTNLVMGMVAVVATEPDINQSRFESLARELFQDQYQIRNIGGAPDLVIRLMYPLEGNRSAIGLDFNKNDAQRELALRAIEENRMVIAGPVKLVQGGVGIIARVPVYSVQEDLGRHKFWGLLSAVIDVSKLFAASGLPELEQEMHLAIRGRDAEGADGQFFLGNSDILDLSPEVATVSLPYGNWQILAVPHQGWPTRATNESAIVLRFMLVMALIVIPLFFVGRLLSERNKAVNELNFQKLAIDEHAIVSVTDVKGNILYANKKFCDLSGYSYEEIIGANHRLINSGCHTKSFFKEMWRTIASGQVWHGEICNQAKDGNRYWVASTIVPLIGEANKPIQYISVRTDITAEKEKENVLAERSSLLVQQLEEITEAQRRVEEQAAELQKFAETEAELRNKAEAAERSKSEFLASMSHEIRTPMTSVIGFAEILLESNLSKNARMQVEAIKESSMSLLGIINDILDMSKLESGKFKIELMDMDLHGLVDDVVGLFSRKQANGPHGLEIKANIQPDVPHGIRSDPTRIRQILVNLVGNAVKFTETGEVTVSVSSVSKGTDKPVLRFEVRDTGIGIKQEDVGKLFAEFTQADASITRRFEGTGLGLSISKKLIEMLGGQIGVNSIYGKGSCFWFELPYLSGDVRNLRKKSTLMNATTFHAVRPLHILIVDDNKFNQQIISSIITGFGHTCDIAENGMLGIEMHNKGTYDLILMDIRMPVMSGPDATRKIRAMENEKKSIPIIALTADAMAENKKGYIEAGMNCMVTKPINRAELALMINRTMGEIIHQPKVVELQTPIPEAQPEPENNEAIEASVNDFLKSIGAGN